MASVRQSARTQLSQSGQRSQQPGWLGSGSMIATVALVRHADRTQGRGYVSTSNCAVRGRVRVDTTDSSIDRFPPHNLPKPCNLPPPPPGRHRPTSPDTRSSGTTGLWPPIMRLLNMRITAYSLCRKREVSNLQANLVGQSQAVLIGNDTPSIGRDAANSTACVGRAASQSRQPASGQ